MRPSGHERDSLGSAIVRLGGPASGVAGSGFLITKDRVATCAHVVARALGVDEQQEETPAGRVMLDFPLLRVNYGGEIPSVEADVADWQPLRDDGTGDIAILRLATRAPTGALPAPTVVNAEVWNHPFRVLGFPRVQADGVWVAGQLRGQQGTGWIQMQAAEGEPSIDPGFSGAPVWDDQHRGVVGMTVSSERTQGATAYLIPIPALGDAWQEGQINPYRGLAPFREEDSELFYGRDSDVERLLERVREHELLAVVGPSGSGKSSLVSAGLIPHLRAEGVRVVNFRPDVDSDPVDLLTDAVGKVLVGDHESAVRRDAVRELVRDPDALSRELEKATADSGLLLFLDQFEELVVANRGSARELLRLVTELTDRQRRRPGKPLPLRVVATLRSGSLDDLVTASTAERLQRGLFFLSPMEREQLHEVILEPAAAVGGLAFEAGLAERILDDTSGEPGSLPLVQLGLDQLWRRRLGGWLTHNAYEKLGRVSGALSTTADAVFGLLRGDEKERARRILTQCTRPDGEGGYTRRSVPWSEFDPALHDLIVWLAERRLVVLGSGEGDPARVDLVHQALIDHWSRLRGWLDEDADFLAWLADLRRDTEQWEQANREQGRLLSGAALSESEKWVDTRHSDIPKSPRDFIALSRSHERRRIRRLWTTIVVVTALALVTGTSTVVALRSSATTREQLHNVRATVTVEEARRADQPEVALQLALAAWRENPRNADAYGALLSQWLQWWPVRALYPKHRGVDVNHAYASADGRTVIAVNDSDRTPVQIWTHFERPTPVVAELPVFDAENAAISPDGTLIATVSRSRAVDLWSTVTRQRVRRLQPESLTVPLKSNFVPRLRFSGDGHYLSLVPSSDWEDARVKTWDTATSALISGASEDDSEPTLIVTDISPTREAERFLAKVSGPEGSPVTSHVVESFPSGQGHDFGVGEIISNGDEVLVCGSNDSIDIVDAVTKRLAQHFDDVDCAFRIYSSGEYLYWTESDTGQNSVHVLHRPTGGRYNVNLSTTSIPSDFATFLPGSEDSFDAVMLAVDGFYRVPLSRDLLNKNDWGDLINTRTTVNLRETKVGAITERGEIVILDETYTRLLARTRAPTGKKIVVEFSNDETQLYAATREKLFVYRVDNLALQRVITIPEPPEFAPPDVAESTTRLLSLAADDLVALHAGLLTRWNPRTGEHIGHSILLAQDPYKLDRIARTGNISARPAHPGQVIVHSDELISVWDLPRGKNIRDIPIANTYASSLTVEPNGVMAAYDAFPFGTGLVSLDTGQAAPSLDEENSNSNPLLMVSSLLLTANFIDGSFGESLDIWYWPKRLLIAKVTVPETRDWSFSDDHLISYGPGRKPFTIPLDPNMLAHQLCQISDREFTPDEMALLPAGMSHQRPCLDIH